MSEDFKTCSETTFCNFLNPRLQFYKSKGLVRMDYMNMHTGTITVSIVSYKKKPSDRGLVLNFCPWCGFKFDYGARFDKEKE